MLRENNIFVRSYRTRSSGCGFMFFNMVFFMILILLSSHCVYCSETDISMQTVPDWVKSIYEQEYLGYGFQLPDTVKSDHPRLPFPSKKTIQYYRNHLQDFYTDNPRHSKNPLILYVITRKKKYLEEVIEGIKTAKSKVYNPEIGFQLPYALDWLYDELPDDVRKICIQKCATACRNLLENSIHAIRPTQSWFLNNIGLAGTAEAIAVWREVPEGDELLEVYHRRFFQTCIPMWHVAMGQSGGGISLPSYLYVHSIQSNIVGGMELWSNFLGVNLYQKYNWMKPFGYQPIFLTTPHLCTAPLGDSTDESGMRKIWMEHMPVFAERYDDPYMRWFAYHMHRIKAPQHPVFLTTEYGVWHEYDPSNKTMHTLQAGFPTEWFFDGWGLVAMRSDWTENATYALFKVGDVTTNHTHCDSGMFYIYKRGGLAIDSGSYTACGSPHHVNYSALAIAHNVVTVTDPADKFEPNDGGQRAYISQFVGSPRDIEHWIENREIYEAGDMLAYDSTPHYVYAAGDITAAYQNALSGSNDSRHRTRRLQNMTRSFLYIRPDYFIVFDKVVTTDPRFKVRWLLHTVNKPNILDDTIQATRTEMLDTSKNRSVAGKTIVYAYPMLIQNIKHNRTGRDYRPIFYQYELNGKLFCKTLLPKEHFIEVIGGKGKEFWVDGANHNINTQGKILIPDTKLPRDVGSWRVEVNPTKISKEHLFLHVLQVSNNKVSEIVPIEYIERIDSVGLRMKANNCEYEVLFKRSGIGGHISIIRQGKTITSKNLATEIRNNQLPF